jgi:IclR family transcriptional regulator, pca regulon regulatory protein
MKSSAAQFEAFSGDPNFMASLARGLAVLRAFADAAGAQSVAQLSQRTAIPRSAVRRCLYTLAQLGYVASEDGRTFRLAPTVLTLGYAYVSSAPLAIVAQPLLDRVSSQMNESCSLAVLHGEDVLYLARSKAAQRIMSVDLGTGSRLPAYCTSLGRVLLAGLPSDELERYLRGVALVKRTERTIDTVDALRQVLAEVRTAGYALVDQELEIGLRSLAVPVTNHLGKVVAAMNMGTEASRLSADDLEGRLLPALKQAAWELGLALP